MRRLPLSVMIVLTTVLTALSPGRSVAGHERDGNGRGGGAAVGAPRDTGQATSARQADDSPVITFTTEGESFSPVITVEGTPVILWTFADGSTSSAPNPQKSYGSPGTRANTLLVTPWSALRRINIGYDGGDSGSPDIEMVPDQHVSSVAGLEIVAPTLAQWCSSYNQITSLDFSNFTNLDTIECFLSQQLASVNLANTPKLKRACFEDCNLGTLDVSGSPLLEDLRGAQNSYPTIVFGDVGSHIWHICVRDNPQMTDQAVFSDMSPFPNLAELLIWNDNQAGTLRIPATHPGRWVGILADGNHYTSLNLVGALQSPGATGIISFRNNQLASIGIAGCVQLTELYLENNALGAPQLETLLGTLDALGRNKSPINTGLTLLVNVSGNAVLSPAGRTSAQKLAAKGWTVIATGETFEPPPPPDTGETRVDFTTQGDTTSMQCNLWGTATATWHWSDGTTSPAVSGEGVTKSGLGSGTHAHHLLVSNGAALTRFGSAGAGQGHLVTISGLELCPLLDILFVYSEASLTSIGRTHTTKLREYHLMSTALSTAAMDQVFADAVASGVTGGTLYCNNNGTVASAADRLTLASRGWTLAGGGPDPFGSGDVNGDGQVNVSDVFYLINYLFAGGPGPAPNH